MCEHIPHALYSKVWVISVSFIQDIYHALTHTTEVCEYPQHVCLIRSTGPVGLTNPMPRPQSRVPHISHPDYSVAFSSPPALGKQAALRFLLHSSGAGSVMVVMYFRL